MTLSRDAIVSTPFPSVDGTALDSSATEGGAGPSSTAEGAVLRGAEVGDLPVVSFGASTTAAGGSPEQPAADDQHDTVPDIDPEEHYQQGWEAGHEAALASIEARREQTTRALTEAIAAVDLALARQQDAADELAVDLALELTRLLLNRELASIDDPGREAILRCLDEIPHSVRAVFRLNPDDLARFQDPDDLLAGRNCELVADDSLASGDVVVEFDGATIDGTLSAALARIAEVLKP